MFEHRVRIRMRNIDATGCLFFPEQFTLALEAFEEFLLATDFHKKKTEEQQAQLPVVHAEADYKSPLRLWDLVTIQLGVKNLGNSSFTLLYFLYNHTSQEVGRVTVVHVCINPVTRKPIPIPIVLRNYLEQHLWNSDLLNTVLKEQKGV